MSLDLFTVNLYSNANDDLTSPNQSQSLPSVELADGDVFVIANSSASAEILALADLTSAITFYNGNDALVLFETASGPATATDAFKIPGSGITNADEVTLRRTDLTRRTDPFSAENLDGLFDAADRGAQDDVSTLGLPPGDGGGDPPPPPPEPVCDATDVTLISEVQGDGFASPFDGAVVTIEGVVTTAGDDFFFVQEEDGDSDGNPATSEGIFVFDRRQPLPPVGATVQLTAEVAERFGLTQMAFPDIVVCDVAPIQIEPTPLTLPADDEARESLEGMLVTNAQDLQVTGLFTAYRYGELGLALDGPLLQPTSVFAPDDPRATDLAAANAERVLKVNDRDEAFSQFNDFPWELFDEGLSAGDTMPAGRVVGGLTFSFGEYKIEPLNEDVDGDRIFFPETDDTDTIQPVPSLSAGNDVAAFNVLNYFNTFGDSAVLRGATNAEEFELQSAKIVDAINTLDAAVLGLVEIENDYEDFYDDDPTTVPSIVTLVEALNDDAGYDRWTWVQPGEDQLVSEGLGNGGLGTDAIAVGLIYQPDRASTIGPAVTFDIDAELTGDADNNRWPLAQTFQVDGPGPDVTVVVNHFKSKGSPCTDTAGPGFGFGDDVRTDLTGSCNLVREYAAQQLLDWLDTRPTGVDHDRSLVVGDLNSYEEEGPIGILEDAGYVDMVDTRGGDAFTYKFDGRYGRLDYVMASSDAAKFVTDAAVWQINSRAPVGYLYFNDPLDRTFYASSDHDPVVVSLGAPGRADKDDKGNGRGKR